MPHISTISLMSVLVSVSSLQIAGAVTRNHQHSTFAPATRSVVTARTRTEPTEVTKEKIESVNPERESTAIISIFRGCERCEYLPLHRRQKGVYE